MRIRTALVAAPVVILAAACSASAPAQQAPAASPVTSAYQRDITAMTAHCAQDPAQLSAMVAKVHQLEVSTGIHDETMTQLAGHLLTAVSAYKSRVSCAEPFGAYLTLREEG
jgi:hemoglobin-like flavoprotein